MLKQTISLNNDINISLNDILIVEEPFDECEVKPNYKLFVVWYNGKILGSIEKKSNNQFFKFTCRNNYFRLIEKFLSLNYDTLEKAKIEILSAVLEIFSFTRAVFCAGPEPREMNSESYVNVRSGDLKKIEKRRLISEGITKRFIELYYNQFFIGTVDLIGTSEYGFPKRSDPRYFTYLNGSFKCSEEFKIIKRINDRSYDRPGEISHCLTSLFVYTKLVYCGRKTY